MVYLLFALALIVPVLGAIVLRLLGDRLSPTQVVGSAAVLFGLAIISTLVLARSDVSSLRVGNLTLLLPVRTIADSPAPPEATPVDGNATASPATTDPSPASSPIIDITPTSPAPEATATPEPPTATPEPPTATPEPPTATPEPPTATPEPPPAEPEGPRRYVVQPGDTLRGIAEQFGVSVQAILDANNLTPEEGDSLRVGQELIIP
ncbi:MAG: LysM peptidoglycan-binding domain-containing protein [Chloroflexales bacterium]|nr:LysM peptidoglycan-binding domain-containing protein [Chloroflexales bacterium]